MYKKVPLIWEISQSQKTFHWKQTPSRHLKAFQVSKYNNLEWALPTEACQTEKQLSVV